MPIWYYGIVFFDIDRNNAMNEKIKNERNEIINLMLTEKDKGVKTQEPNKKKQIYFQCETVENQF